MTRMEVSCTRGQGWCARVKIQGARRCGTRGPTAAAPEERMGKADGKGRGGYEWRKFKQAGRATRRLTPP